ncbi:MAG: nucleotide exchange factor GrpE [Candidatus Poseidoniales archaeon]|nr:MAG: nucleotide exchange factor GrpE [Candidatus Poseidoniales archaeon]
MSEDPEDDVPIEGDIDEGKEEDSTQSLEERILELEKELQYSAAEIINTRQRLMRDKNEALKYGSANLASKIIPIIDSLARAVESSGKDKNSESIVEGVKLIMENITLALNNEGIEKIEIVENSFDPTTMEAIASIPCPDGEEPGKIVQVIEDGYKLHDRVLRAAKVIVYEG